MLAFIDDVKQDSPGLEKDIDFKTKVQSRIDSLFDLFAVKKESRSNNDIYFVCRRTTRSSDFYYHDGTIQQLAHNLHWGELAEALDGVGEFYALFGWSPLGVLLLLGSTTVDARFGKTVFGRRLPGLPVRLKIDAVGKVSL